MVGQRPQHAVSKLACLVLSSARSCRSSIWPDRLLAGLHCRIFLSYGLQVVIREVHRSYLGPLICPAQDNFIFHTVLIISITFDLSLTQMLVFLYLYVMLNILLSILVCAPQQVCSVLVWSVSMSLHHTIRHSWQHTGVVHLARIHESVIRRYDRS